MLLLLHYSVLMVPSAMEREELIKVVLPSSSCVENLHVSIVFKKFLSSCILETSTMLI